MPEPERAPVGAAAVLGAMHKRRVHRMLVIGSVSLFASCAFWTVFFSSQGNALMAGLNSGAAALAVWTWVVTRKGRLRLASRMLLGVTYVMLCGSCLFIDVPTAGAGRSMDQFLLALGLVSCLLMREERPWLRHGTPLLFLITYVVFDGSNLGYVTPLLLPDSVRASGSWFNQGIALVIVYATLYVIQNDAAERNGPANELRDALNRGDLQLHYQPQVAVTPDGERVVGAEALVRWTHARRGAVAPAEFIALAERSGLMLPLGEWVLRTACTQISVWSRRPETASLVLAVNVSASQFARPDFVSHVLTCVNEAGISPSQLKLELTESMLASDLADIIAKMQALKPHGIRFSLDDFGTGFSSLSYLRSLPLDQLKIDQSFVRDLLNSPNDAAIAQTVVNLGRNLGLEVIAEGVETQAQRDFLASIGCDIYQGYLFSRALPAADFDVFLRRRRPIVPGRKAVELPQVIAS
jgi:EAL domain-containing protein (putative c-di-GMP-specific phosphodiesterase class I)